MDTLTLDNIDKQFAPELLSLMGEWFTYYMVGRENGLACDKVPTIRDFFETGRISRHGAFSDELIEYSWPTSKAPVYLVTFLKSYGIIGESHDEIKNYRYLKPIVSYDDVKNTFLKNLSSGKTAIFPCFAYFSNVFLPRTESVAFSCDVGCYPLIEALCAESYMGKKGETFHWTSKIRILMEILELWKTKQDLDLQAKKVEEAQRGMSILDRMYEEAFEESLDDEDLTPLINFVKKNPFAISFTASRELEQMRITSVIPIIGLTMLFGGLISSINPDTVEEDLSETSEAMKILRGRDFWKVIELFEPKRINLHAKTSTPSKTYKLPWGGDPI